MTDTYIMPTLARGADNQISCKIVFQQANNLCIDDRIFGLRTGLMLFNTINNTMKDMSATPNLKIYCIDSKQLGLQVLVICKIVN